MILQSDDTLSIPVGYLKLKYNVSEKEHRPIDAITIGLLGLVYQFKGTYITNIHDLSQSFSTTEDVINDRLDMLSKTGVINIGIIKEKIVLTHGIMLKDIADNAYAKRASFAKKMRGDV